MPRDQNGRSDPCGVVVALSIFGGRWKGLIIWWLCSEPKRFNELRRLLLGISQRVLSNQLRQLEQDGIVCREQILDSPNRVEYSLTDLRHSLVPLLDRIRAWGMKHLSSVLAAQEDT
jgi:DNA-binding HxlR family transcriptional regulator